MSVKVMGKVWDADLPPNLKLVLLAYADAAEHDGTEIWPGHKRLASMTGYSRSQVERNTRDLVERGVLVRVEKGHRGRRATFLIPLEGLDAISIVSQDATQSEPDSVASSTDSVASDVLKGSAHATPPILDPSSTSVLKIAPKERDRNPWWDTTVEIFGEPTEGQRKLYGRFVAMVSDGELKWGTNEIRRRAALLAELWGHRTVTVASLEKHWSRFDGAISNVTDSDVEAFTAAQDREAMLERLSDE